MINTEDYRVYTGNETLRELVGALKMSERNVQT